MAWVYLDDQFPTHPKVALAGGDAAWLFVCALCYCRQHGTEGRIPKSIVPRLTDRRNAKRLAERLVEVVLWVEDGDHYRIHDWDEWNRSQSSRSEAGRKAARARWDAKRNADASESQDDRTESADASTCPVPSPVPSPSLSSGETTPPTAADAVGDDRGGGDRRSTAEAAIARAAVQIAERHGHGSNGGYIRSIRERVTHQHGSEVHQRAHQGESVETVAAWIMEVETPPERDPKPRPEDTTTAANLAQFRRHSGEVSCVECEDRGVVDTEDGDAVRCSCQAVAS